MTRYERITVAISIAALLISTTVATKDFIFNALQLSDPKISIQRNPTISWTGNKWAINGIIQILNTGAADFRPGRIEVEISTEGGGPITFESEWISFQNGGSNINDLVIKPGVPISGPVFLMEKTSITDDEEYEDFIKSVQASAKADLDRKIDLREKTLQRISEKVYGSGSIGPERITSVFPGFAAMITGTAEKEQLAKAQEKFSASTKKLRKGDWRLTLKLVGFDGSIAHKKSYRFTLYERDTKSIANSFAGLPSAQNGGTFIWPYTPQTTIRLFDI